MWAKRATTQGSVWAETAPGASCPDHRPLGSLPSVPPGTQGKAGLCVSCTVLGEPEERSSEPFLIYRKLLFPKHSPSQPMRRTDSRFWSVFILGKPCNSAFPDTAVTEIPHLRWQGWSWVAFLSHHPGVSAQAELRHRTWKALPSGRQALPLCPGLSEGHRGHTDWQNPPASSGACHCLPPPSPAVPPWPPAPGLL